MKKHILFFSLLGLSAGSLFAAAANPQQEGQEKMLAQAADCSTMSVAEQSFANQLNDMNNRAAFCTQFTPQQRQQAMQMNGQLDSSGNMMNPDQAVQQVMQTNPTPAMQQRKRTGGGCPVK
jgi:hypothetical protein